MVVLLQSALPLAPEVHSFIKCGDTEGAARNEYYGQIELYSILSFLL